MVASTACEQRLLRVSFVGNYEAVAISAPSGSTFGIFTIVDIEGTVFIVKGVSLCSQYNVFLFLPAYKRS